MKKVALLKQEKESRLIEHKNQQKHISFVDNRIAAMQRRSNMLSVIQRRVDYSATYCYNINGASQKFNELNDDLSSALLLAKHNFWNQYGKNVPDKHWFIRIVENSRSTGVLCNFVYAAWGQYVEYFLNAIVDHKNSWERQKKVGNHRPDYYQLMGGVELYADVTSASQAGGRHITSKLEGVKFKRPVCAADIVYDDNAMEDCLNYYNSGNKLTTTDKSLLDIKKVLMKFSLNLYELKVEELEPEELNLEKFGSKESILQVIIENKQGLSLKEICNRHEFGFYKTPIEMVSDIQRVFSSWNVLINKSPSPLSLIMIIVMKHVMGVINSHIEKILNAPTWQQRIQILQSRLASI